MWHTLLIVNVSNVHYFTLVYIKEWIENRENCEEKSST